MHLFKFLFLVSTLIYVLYAGLVCYYGFDDAFSLIQIITTSSAVIIFVASFCLASKTQYRRGEYDFNCWL